MVVDIIIAIIMFHVCMENISGLCLYGGEQCEV